MKAKLTRLALIAAAALGLAPATSAFAYDAPRCEDGVMEIDGTNGSYTFSGYCEKVIIAGGDNRVVLGDVGTLEIAGSNQDVTAGNVKVLDLAGGDNSAKLGNIGNAEIYGNDNDVWARVIGIMDVAGGNNGIKSERLGSVSVAGNDHLIEYRQLNPNTRNPKSQRILGVRYLAPATWSAGIKQRFEIVVLESKCPEEGSIGLPFTLPD